LCTGNGRAITARGVKPICPYEHKFENTYFFGAFAAVNGNGFLLEPPFCNIQTSQIFLNEFCKEKPTELKILILDNGAFYQSKALVIPDNIILIFLPAHSPERNAAEKAWWLLIREFVCQTFRDMKELKKHLFNPIKKLRHG